jgi:hypothetical protein
MPDAAAPCGALGGAAYGADRRWPRPPAGFDYATERGAAAAVLQLAPAAPAAAAAAPTTAAAAAAAAAPAAATAVARVAAALHPAPGSQHAARPNLRLLGPPPPRQQQPGPAQQAAGDLFFDYCNGGPVFLAPDGGTELGGLPGVRVLATFQELQGAAAALRCGRGQPGGRPTLPPRAGAPRGAARPGGLLNPLGCRRRRVEVGLGVAVLCGTHPELAPAWLDDGAGGPDVVPAPPAGGAPQAAAHRRLELRSEQGGAAAWDAAAAAVGDAAALQQHTAALRRALLSTERVRTRFWRLLLAQALRQEGLVACGGDY